MNSFCFHIRIYIQTDGTTVVGNYYNPKKVVVEPDRTIFHDSFTIFIRTV